MSILAPLNKMGVSVSLSEKGKLKLTAKAPNPEAVEFVKRNRAAIITELQKSDLPNPDLPASCPFNTGGFAPEGCRFSHDLLMSLIVAGVMPDPKIGCMFKAVCGERKKQKEAK